MRYINNTNASTFKPIPLTEQPSFWDKYKWIIIGIIAGAILLILVIFAFYFVQRRSS